MTSTPSILIVDTCYPGFLRSVGFQSPARQSDDYAELLSQFMRFRFGTSDAYSSHLTSLGWKAQEVIPNSIRLQTAWAQRHGLSVSPRLGSLPHSVITRLPVARTLSRHLPTLHRVLEAQVRETRPTVLYFQDLNFTPPSLIRRLRKFADLVVGQIASPLPPKDILRSYDVILSSLPNQIEQIRSAGVNAEFLAIGFDERVLDEFPEPDRDLELTFVGGVSRSHSSTMPLLTEVAHTHPNLRIFGYGASELPPPLQRLHGGERWGADMYQVLRQSQVTLNRHIDVAEGFANNMRLFEATGCGALLVTDRGRNLSQYFAEDEVLAYSTPEEAAQLITWAQRCPDEAASMSRKAQERTVREHSYSSRMSDLDQILRTHLGAT